MRAQGGSAFGPPDWLSRVFIAGGWVDVRHNWDSSLFSLSPSLSPSSLCSSRIPPSLLHSAIICVCLLRFTACYLAYRFFAWFLYPKPPWSLSVGRIVCDYSRARFSPFRTIDSS